MRWLLTLLLSLSALSKARAHDVRGTIIFVDLGSDKVGLEVQLPVQELQTALKQRPTWRGPIELPADLRPYVAAHLAASANGRPFALVVEDAVLTRVDDGDSVVAHVTLSPPAHQSVRTFDLRSDLIVHEVVNHNTFVFLRHDLQSGRLDERPQLLGALHYQSLALHVDGGEGSLSSGLRASFALGVRHIAEGIDHLMFLLALLLPAGLAARRGRWREAVDWQSSVMQVVRIVTAFTVGHSLTLLLGALDIGVRSSNTIEILIACSIFVSALHALRPLFAGRELWVAAGFGLVHGLAFSSALQGLAVDGKTLALSVLGFNLGVEAMQLAVVALVMPVLVLLRSSRAHRFVRIAGASVALAAAAGWIAERGFDVHTPWFPLAKREQIGQSIRT